VDLATIESESGELPSEPKLINQIFFSFYKELYTSDCVSTTGQIKSLKIKLLLFSQLRKPACWEPKYLSIYSKGH
jgi:hypothetical protein